METRIGRQTPTQSVVLPYKKTKGQEAIKLYSKTGKTAQPWQELLVYDMLATNKDKLWVHTKYGYSVARRNGKNEVLIPREMWGLKNGEQILHTAHRTTTTHKAWERLLVALEKAKIPIVSSYRAFGKEHIELENGARIEFRTRTATGGLGEGFDLLVIDEAQEYTADQESSLKYTVSASPNPQTIFCGTPPTPVSTGTVFIKLRQNILSGESVNAGWSEWSVEKESDPRDRDLWYETNPSLGTILTERTVADEIGDDPIDFNIQRLGLWLRYNQKSAISKVEWEELKAESFPKLRDQRYIGIKYSRDGNSAAMAVASRTDDDRIFVECIDCRSTRSGDAWMFPFLRNPHIKSVAIDGVNGQTLLADDMKQLKLGKPILPTVKEVIVANTTFEQGLFSRTICHMDQPSLTQAVSNCDKRAIGTNGGFGYKSIRDDVDITLLDCIILAYWLCSISKKEKVKQRINY